ncbi:MAG: hypothetical protein ACI9RP_001915, partial [Cyclobacteriaceae bacterium]
MKRITLLTATLILTTGLLYAQKPKLSKVENFFKGGDYAAALEMVTMAETYEKTKDDPKT